MTRLLRPYLAFFLVATLALTGQSMAVARGMAAPSGEMVLCIGGGPVVVPVDADGNPTSEPHYCPDCVMSLMDVVSLAWKMPAYDAGAGKRIGIASPTSLIGSVDVEPQARGPPVA